jgi:hypothetical protein
MGLSVAIAGGIVMVTIMLVMLTIPNVVTNIFSIGEVSSQSSKIEDSVSKTEITTESILTQVGSPRVNFTLSNQGSTTLWDFNNFNVLVEYTGAISGKRTEQLSLKQTNNGECLGAVPTTGQWCIQSILNDIADPKLLNFGEKANIRTSLNENLASTNVIVAVATDNGVTFKTGNPSCGSGIPLPSCKKSGWFMPSSVADDAPGGFGGILSDITSDGAQAYDDDVDGTRWSTPVTAVASTEGGIQSLNANNFHAEWNIYLKAKVQQSATTSHRIFVGFRSSATLPNNDAVCGTGSLSCAGFVIDSNDAAWQIVTNAADVAETRTACLSGCTDDTLVHTLEVRSDAANNRWGFKWDDGTEQFVSGDIPAATIDLFVDVEMESTGTNNSIDIYYIYVEKDSK